MGEQTVLGSNVSNVSRWMGHPGHKQPSTSFPLAGRQGHVGSHSSIALVSCTALIRGNRLEQCLCTQTEVVGQRFPGDQSVMSCTESPCGGQWLLPTATLGLGTQPSEVARTRQGTAGGVGTLGVQEEKS